MAKDEAKWAYWTKQIKDWRSSGLSRNAYCKREGLKPTTFDYWRPLIVSDHAEDKAVKPPVRWHGHLPPHREGELGVIGGLLSPFGLMAPGIFAVMAPLWGSETEGSNGFKNA